MTKVALKLNKKKISLGKYAGKWVALIGNKVVASAKTLKKLEEKIRKKKIKEEPVLFLVPKKKEGPYVLIHEIGI